MSDDAIIVFLVDDHQPIVDGLMTLVEQDTRIRVVGHCNDGLEVMDRVQVAKPDVLVLDISLPGVNGLELCRLVKKALPATAVLMLTMHASEQCILGALRNGALGYVTKDSAALEFRAAVYAVSRGAVYLGRGVPRTLLTESKMGRGP